MEMCVLESLCTSVFVSVCVCVGDEGEATRAELERRVGRSKDLFYCRQL